MRKLISNLAIVTLVAAPFALSGCGSGSQVATAPVASSTKADKKNMYAVQEDDYGFQSGTFITSSRSDGTLTMRIAIAASVTDPAFKTVYRIDIADPAAVTKGTYGVGAVTTGLTAFPGNIYLFNGHNSTLLKIVSGTITLDTFGAAPGDQVNGSFSVVFADNNAATAVKPTYTLKSSFSFVVNSADPISPAPDPVPAAAFSLYTAKCAGCHLLGSVDTVGGGAPDLSLKGGELEAVLATGHRGLVLAADEKRSLQVLCNAN